MLRRRTADVSDEVALKLRNSGETSASMHEELMGELSDEARQYMYFHEDGRLFISKSHKFNKYVTGFQGRLNRLNVKYKPNYVELTTIKQLRDSSDSQAYNLNASNMQRFAMQLFEKGVNLRASDIHIRCSQNGNSSILMRIHGDIEFIEEHTYVFGTELCTAIYQVMSDVSDASFKPMSRQDARIADKSKIPAGLDGIRVATTPQVGGFVMVLRLLYNDTVESYDLSLLGYLQDQCNAIELMKRRPTGINIIAGPTGSGKSTTLQRVLGSIIKNTNGSKHVVTVEDPPEYPIPGAVQTPVTNAASEQERSQAFQAAIKAAMRIDPDMMMIGEIRDEPSATLAVRAAMTGHQVWSTLHANSAFGILDRLMDLGVPMEMLTDHSIITGLTCQRLVKLLCPHCKVALTEVMNRYSSGDISRILSVLDVEHVYVIGEGCEHCRHTGTMGRTVVAETVITDPTLMTYIRKNDRIKAMRYWKKDQQGKTMLDHAIEKIRAGVIDPLIAEDVVGPLNMGLIEADSRIEQKEINDAVA